MVKKLLRDPDDIHELLQKRFHQQHRNWLLDKGAWPLSIPLGIPSERQALDHMTEVRAWQERWQHWRGAGELQWAEKRWHSIGLQSLPERFTVNSPEALTSIIGQHERWQRATQKYQELTDRWPQLVATLPTDFEILADWPDTQLQHLVQVVDWLATHQASGLYIRQVPIPGIDSKWLESRQKLLTRWLSCILEREATGANFYQLTGIQKPPLTLRFKLLDQALRAEIGGLADLQLPVHELTELQLPVQAVFIVENLQTGLAFSDLPGSMVFMKQGYAVDLFGQLPWLQNVKCYYWGDIDTDGFAILDRLRHYLPHAQSLLMDCDTLLSHRNYWSSEPKTSNVTLQALTPEEESLFNELKQGKYGSGVRLEQERIAWNYAWKHIQHV